MKKILKILLAVFIATITMLSLVACSPANDGGTSSKGLLCKKIDGVYTVYKYVDEGNGVTVLNIKDILAEKGITEDVRIKKGAFDGNNTLVKIIVPDQVVEIDEGAFRNMQKLEALEVPFVGKSVNSDAFELESAKAEDKSVDAERTIAHYFGANEYDAGRMVTINYGAGSTTCYMPVTFNTLIINATKTSDGKDTYSVPMYALNGATNIKNVVLTGNKLGAIGVGAFKGCVALESIEIPATVKTIYKDAFNGCTKLSTVAFESSASGVVVKESAFSGCTSIKYLGEKVDTLPTVKTVDLSKFSEIYNKAFDFGNENATYTVLNAGSFNLALVFGDTKIA